MAMKLMFCLIRSFWTLSGSPRLLSHPVVTGLAHDKSCTAPQIIYSAAQGWGISPLTGTTSEKHMQQDLNIKEIALTGADLDRIKSAMDMINRGG